MYPKLLEVLTSHHINSDIKKRSEMARLRAKSISKEQGGLTEATSNSLTTTDSVLHGVFVALDYNEAHVKK